MVTGVNGGYNGYGSEWWIEWIRERMMDRMDTGMNDESNGYGSE